MGYDVSNQSEFNMGIATLQYQDNLRKESFVHKMNGDFYNWAKTLESLVVSFAGQLTKIEDLEWRDEIIKNLRNLIIISKSVRDGDIEIDINRLMFDLGDLDINITSKMYDLGILTKFKDDPGLALGR